MCFEEVSEKKGLRHDAEGDGEQQVLQVLDHIKFQPDGLVPAIIQDSETGTVLCLGYMNREMLSRTLKEGVVWFYSRSRQRPWLKGETSGHFLMVEAVGHDCDKDALLLLVKPMGPVCHTLTPSCFTGREIESPNASVPKEVPEPRESTFPSGVWNALSEVAEIIDERRDTTPDNSYVASVMAKGYNQILKKIGEEASEVVMAAKDVEAYDRDQGGPSDESSPVEQGDAHRALVSEVADLWFHSMILLSYVGLGPNAVLKELSRRRRK
jgi:phosphoribosyl-ATP pyrophosphohydrolase/phosphoribosyl-AMP cyclohydrolase